MKSVAETIESKTRQEKPVLSFEIFPPKPGAPFEPVRAAALELASLSPRPDFISVTYGAGGSTKVNTVEIAAGIQQDSKVPALAHLTCAGASREGIEEAADAMERAGIRSVLALRGDRQADAADSRPGDFAHASDIVPYLKRRGFSVGGACYPEGHPEAPDRITDLDNLMRKIEAGCDFLTTQMFFENDMLYTFLYRLRSRNASIPVLAGIMPVVSVSQISRMLKLSNAFMPRRLLALADRFRASPAALRQAGIAYATEQIIDLVSNGVTGIHLYTMNKPDVARAILSNLSEILSAE